MLRSEDFNVSISPSRCADEFRTDCLVQTLLIALSKTLIVELLFWRILRVQEEGFDYKLTVLLTFQVPQYSLCRCPIVNDWVVQETFLKRARPSQCPFGTLELSNSSCPNCLCGFFLPLLPFRRLFSDIFSRRFSSEKSPNITVASFLFYRQTTISLWLGHFSYNLNYSNYYHKAKSGQRNLVQKGPPFSFFFTFLT